MRDINRRALLTQTTTAGVMLAIGALYPTVVVARSVSGDCAAIAKDTQLGQMAADLGARVMDIHWPAGFEPERSDLFAHNETRVDVACETVWRHIVVARAWPDWYPNAQGWSPRRRAHARTGRALALDDVRPRHREPRAGIRAGSAARLVRRRPPARRRPSTIAGCCRRRATAVASPWTRRASDRERLRSARQTKLACIVAIRCGWPHSNGSPRAAEPAWSHEMQPPTHLRGP